ncbi:hypothetical protein D3C75_809710 [compost metagenome]
MGADIDQRPAALRFLIQEHAPGWHRAAADGLGFGIIDFSKPIILAYGVQVSRIRPEAVLVPNGQLLSCPPRRVNHRLSFRSGFGHGLLTHHMLPGLHSSDGNFRMGNVRRTHMDHIYTCILKQLFIIGVNRSAFISELCFCLLGTFRHDIAERYHHRTLHFLQRWHMFAVGDTAAADNSYL